MPEATEPSMGHPFQVAAYSSVLSNALDDMERYRAVMHDLPRRFHATPRELRAAALREPAPLTGTGWDALLAAMVEHLARLHGHPIPSWAEEPERFLDPPWVLSTVPDIARESVLFAPAAFIRHGTFPDLASLDMRGGEKHTWAPSREGEGWPYQAIPRNRRAIK